MWGKELLSAYCVFCLGLKDSIVNSTDGIKNRAFPSNPEAF